MGFPSLVSSLLWLSKPTNHLALLVVCFGASFDWITNHSVADSRRLNIEFDDFFELVHNGD